MSGAALHVAEHRLDASVDTPALNREGEARAPGGDLLAEVVDLSNVAAGNLGLEVLELVGLLRERRLNLLADLDGLIDVGTDALEIGLAKATRGHGRSADTDTAGGKGGLVTGNGVLVAGNVDLLKNGLNASTVKAVLTEVEEDHVRVGAVGNELVAEGLELVLESLGVVNNLLLVGLEVGAGSLLQGNSESSDGVVVGTALVTGEDREVDGVLEVVEGLLAGLGVDGADALAEEDHGTTRATEGLVGGGGDDISVLEGGRDDAGGNETGDVSHVNDKVGTNGVGDLAHATVVDQAAVGRGTSNENLGAEEDGVLLEGVVVNDAGLQVDSVGHRLEVGGDGRDPVRGLSLAYWTSISETAGEVTHLRWGVW